MERGSGLWMWSKISDRVNGSRSGRSTLGVGTGSGDVENFGLEIKKYYLSSVFGQVTFQIQ